MIHEYALDPEVLSTWASFRYFVDQFGVPHGRLISQFPRRWKAMVYDASLGVSPLDRKRIEIGLSAIDGKLLKTARNYDGTKEWVSNAVASHVDRPFRLIISTDESAVRANVTAAAAIDAATPGWSMEVNPVARRASAMAATAEMLLRCGNEILFIDPHFSCGSRHLRPLEAFLAAAGVLQGHRLEYHLKDSGTADWFKSKLAEFWRLRNLLGGRPLIFVRWREIPEQETLHARYILTDRGGLQFENGLDEGADGETTNVTLLPETLYRIRRAQFTQGSTTYQLLDAWSVSQASIQRVQPNGQGGWMAAS